MIVSIQCSGVEAKLVAAQIKLETAVREKNEGKDLFEDMYWLSLYVKARQGIYNSYPSSVVLIGLGSDVIMMGLWKDNKL